MRAHAAYKHPTRRAAASMTAWLPAGSAPRGRVRSRRAAPTAPTPASVNTRSGRPGDRTRGCMPALRAPDGRQSWTLAQQPCARTNMRPTRAWSSTRETFREPSRSAARRAGRHARAEQRGCAPAHLLPWHSCACTRAPANSDSAETCHARRRARPGRARTPRPGRALMRWQARRRRLTGVAGTQRWRGAGRLRAAAPHLRNDGVLEVVKRVLLYGWVELVAPPARRAA